MSDMPDICKERWFQLWRHVDAEGNPKPIWNKIVSQYGEPHRKYHTILHIHQCLNELETLWQEVSDPYLIAWALWFHDYYYDVNPPGNNEERSALEAIQVACNASVQTHIAVNAGWLILGTKDHTATAHTLVTLSTTDLNVFRGIDLSILGKPWPTYDLYRRNIRQEYIHIPWELYARKRSEILRGFAQQERIFHHPSLYEQYDKRAKENLRREIRLLQRSEERNAEATT